MLADADPCVFCQIVAGEAPASIVYDDPTVLAFMDIGAVNPGHVLVVPRRHAAELAELDEPTGARLFQVAMGLARAIRASGVRCEGINLFLADGAAAGQEVFHVHLHVIPRFQGDAFRIQADRDARPSRAELDSVAARIRQAEAALDQ